MNIAASLHVSTPSDREVEMTRIFDAPRNLVFDAWTKPELLKRWMGPDGWSLPVCEIDLRAGGALRFMWRHLDGRTLNLSGVYREIVAPERIVHTELFEEFSMGGETLVTTLLSERFGRTTVVQTIVYASAEARDGALGSGMTRGVAASMDRLADLLAETTAG
jgi:uncharacterized protein YndB with AHSA1/START domain